MEYRTNEYFNENDTYLVEGTFSEKETKLHFDKGHWWCDWMGYKCTSVKMKKV